jgi:hypothetical protein
MNRLRALGGTSIVLFVVGSAAGPASIRLAAAQAAPIRTVLGALIPLVCWLSAIIVAICSFLGSVRSKAPQDRLTLVLARGPLVLVGGALLAGLALAVSGR